MSTEPLDPATIMAEHKDVDGKCYECITDVSIEYGELAPVLADWPCLPYLLAAENAALRASAEQLWNDGYATGMRAALSTAE